MNDRRYQKSKPAEETALFSLKSERTVVGAALQDEAFFWQMHARLRPQHFAVSRLARIWEALLAAVEKGKPPTMTWIPLYIRGDKEDEAEESVLFYCNLLKNDAIEEGLSAAELHADTIFQLANKRFLIDSLDRAKAKILTAEVGMAPTDMQDIAMKSIGLAVDQEFDRHIRSYQDWGDDVWKEVAANIDNEEEGGLGLTCGLSGVEAVLGRLMPGRAYYLAGMSGAGKSAIAAQIAEAAMLQAAERGMGWGYMASLEMTGKEYAQRSLSRSMGIPYQDIEAGNVNRAQVESLANHARRLKRFNMEIDSTPSMTIDTIKSHAISTRNRRGGLALMVVDHMVIIAGEKGETLFDKVTNASGKIKQIAKELNVPIIVLAQLNEKKILDTASGWPNASHLFGGETIVQNADVIAFIHRHELVLNKKEPAKDTPAHDKWVARLDQERGKAHFFNDKRRGGGRVSRELRFNGPLMLFEDV